MDESSLTGEPLPVLKQAGVRSFLIKISFLVQPIIAISLWEYTVVG